MADGIYNALSGAVARSTHLDVIANNIANGATAGFKADRVRFAEILAKAGQDVAHLPADKSFASVDSLSTDLSTGPLRVTGKPLDVAFAPDVFLAVETGRGERFTRDGRLTVGPRGELMTASGFRVLDASGGTIPVPPGPEPTLREDGTISIGPDIIGRLRLVRGSAAAGIRKEAGGALLFVAGGPTPSSAEGESLLRSGTLELSNADPVSSLVEMIRINRMFEATTQVLRTFKTLDSRLVGDAGRRG